VRIQLVPRAAHADFLDLPWREPLEEWESTRLVEVPRGIGRHVVRFVDYAGTFFALKELPAEIAAREYRLLRALDERGIAAVEAVGIVSERARDGMEQLPDVLVTRYLDFSLPYRLALARRPEPDQLERLLDAFAQLLVRLHLSGFFWGDCSLSNALFRRDAGELAAYLVDAETGELHSSLSDGQRGYDLQIAEENVFGELLDVEAQHGGDGLDPGELAAEIPARYERLWSELTAEAELRPGEAGGLDERLRRLNELGFDAGEVEIVEHEGHYTLRLEPKVMEPGHYRRRLLRLTGLDTQENQARRLLADLDAYRRRLAEAPKQPASETAVVGRWLAEVFEPAIAAVPRDLRGKRDAAQLYHELLEHRWYLSEHAGHEVPLEEAVANYVDTVLRALPDEQRLIGFEAPDDGVGSL
jgi:tRNA A-37 threonylcarbamoyl transferase component Bud32